MMNSSAFGLLIFCIACLWSPAYSDMSCPRQSNYTVQPLKYSTSLDPYYKLAVGFIHTIHGQISDDQIQNIINYFKNNKKVTANGLWTVIQPVVVSEVGLIILLVLAVAFIVLMPLVGLLFCCCRCCNNCGGKRYQEKPSCCCCSFLLTMTLLCLIFLVTGIALYSVNNNQAFSSLELVTTNVVDQATKITGYLNATASDLICATEGEFDAAVKIVDGQMTALPNETVASIMETSGVTTLLNLNISLMAILDDVASFKPAYNSVVNNASDLQVSITDFIGKLNAAHGYPNPINESLINQELSFYNNSAATIDNVDIDPVVDFSNSNDLVQMVTPNVLAIEDIGHIVANYTTNATIILTNTDSITMNVATTMQTVISSLVTLVNNLATNLTQSSNSLENGLDGSYKWVKYVSLVIVFPVLAACLLVFVGLCCAGFGHNGRAKPYDRGCCSNCGGNSLMTAVAVLFLFSWLLMLICTAIFAVGFVTEGFVCQPIFEDPNIRGLNLAPTINVTSGGTVWTLNIQQSLLNCESNMAIYSAFDLTNAINLNDIFNPIQGLMKQLININLDGVPWDQTKIQNLPDPTALAALLRGLQNLQNQLNASYKVLATQPNYTISIMESITDYLKIHPSGNLLAEAKNIDISLMNFVTTLNSLANFNSNATNQTLYSIVFVKDMQAADFNNVTNTADITSKFIDDATAVSVHSLNNFITGLNYSIYQQVGACRPVYDVFSNVGVILCKQVLYPLQGWWLALGWCLIFFIPAICFNVRLAKYFRTMDVSYYHDAAGRWTTDSLHAHSLPAPVYEMAPNPAKPAVKMRRYN